jgi:hypothetical protein
MNDVPTGPVNYSHWQFVHKAPEGAPTELPAQPKTRLKLTLIIDGQRWVLRDGSRRHEYTIWAKELTEVSHNDGFHEAWDSNLRSYPLSEDVIRAIIRERLLPLEGTAVVEHVEAVGLHYEGGANTAWQVRIREVPTE